MPELSRGRWTDIALAAVIALPTLVVTGSTGLAWRPHAWPALAMIVIGAAAVFARHRWPVPAALVFCVAYVLAVQSGSFNPNGASPDAIAETIGIAVTDATLSYATGLTARLPASVIGLLALAGAAQWGDPNPFPAMITVGLWLVGRAVRSQRTIAARLGIRAFELAAERDRFTDEAVRYERDRIARELHDVIAHNVSIMVIQASAGQRLAPGDAAAADELLGNITEMTREASADVGGLTRLLAPEQEPAPWAAQIEELLARTARTGVRLDYELAGEVGGLSGAAAQITYRVLQEGLTNALRHAPGAAVRVIVTCGDEVRLEVINSAARPGAVSFGDIGSGRGLTGLAERIGAAGGTFLSGPVPAGGWQLSAALPAMT